MIIIRYHELGLKGKNRREFEKKLQMNVKHCLKKNNISFKQVLRLRGRILIETENECPQLNYLFGISTYSYAKQYEIDMDEIKEAALGLYTKGSFRITCQRSDKRLLPSNELAGEIGAYIVEKTEAPVDLHNPDINIHVEMFNEHSYLYIDKIKGLGGLPVGTAGRVVLLLQNEDSIKAGIRVLKRGCSLDVLKEKDIDWSELKNYEYGFTIKELDSIPEDTEAVVVSDTVDNLKEYPYFVLRPLI